jgi:hypothetical protein
MYELHLFHKIKNQLIVNGSTCHFIKGIVRYHFGGSMELNARILLLTYSTWFIYNLNTV